MVGVITVVLGGFTVGGSNNCSIGRVYCGGSNNCSIGRVYCGE